MRVAGIKFDLMSCEFATARVQDMVASARGMLEDGERAERLRKQKCVACYYWNKNRIGGAAITTRPCGICEVEMTFGNTCTDVLCEKCARKHRVCLQCGADMELKDRRKL